MRILIVLAAIVVAAACIVVFTHGRTDTLPALHVVGRRLVDADGDSVVLHGINRSGAEFSCVEGKGIWDGPTDQPSIDAMKTWNVNVVRIPLNEACWNGRSDVEPAYRGARYREAIRDYVRLLDDNALYVILDLHWSEGSSGGLGDTCSDVQARCQKPMPDVDQSVPFWRSVARTFKGNQRVIFDLFNEPYPDVVEGVSKAAAWRCLRDGGRCEGIDYRVVGMQQLVDTVRATGATNVLIVPGLNWTSDLSRWSEYRPKDDRHNLIAAFHGYDYAGCSTTQCWDKTVAPLMRRVPVIASEIGEKDCGHGYIDRLMGWLDAHESVGYLGWTWNAWESDCHDGPTLITDYDGTPTAFGVGLRDHLTALAR